MPNSFKRWLNTYNFERCQNVSNSKCCPNGYSFRCFHHNAKNEASWSQRPQERFFIIKMDNNPLDCRTGSDCNLESWNSFNFGWQSPKVWPERLQSRLAYFHSPIVCLQLQFSSIQVVQVGLYKWVASVGGLCQFESPKKGYSDIMLICKFCSRGWKCLLVRKFQTAQ